MRKEIDDGDRQAHIEEAFTKLWGKPSPLCGSAGCHWSFAEIRLAITATLSLSGSEIQKRGGVLTFDDQRLPKLPCSRAGCIRV
jgi:hypothetical protein